MDGFGVLLRRLRGHRTQKEAASDLGMPVTTLSTLENQFSIPRGSVLKKLANYYGVPVTYFYSVPSTAMQATSSAKAWLQKVKQFESKENVIATSADADFPEDLKLRVAQRIEQIKK